MKKRLAVWLLGKAERFFLEAHGWVRVESKRVWVLPKDYPFRRKGVAYTHGHAVNAQKQAVYNPMHGGHRERN